MYFVGLPIIDRTVDALSTVLAMAEASENLIVLPHSMSTPSNADILLAVMRRREIQPRRAACLGSLIVKPTYKPNIKLK